MEAPKLFGVCQSSAITICYGARRISVERNCGMALSLWQHSQTDLHGRDYRYRNLPISREFSGYRVRVTTRWPEKHLTRMSMTLRFPSDCAQVEEIRPKGSKEAIRP